MQPDEKDFRMVNYRKGLLDRYWIYQRQLFPVVAECFERLTPPVFHVRLDHSYSAANAKVSKSERKTLREMVSAKRHDLQRIIDYLEDDEMKDWREKGRPKNHIYATIRSLKKQMQQLDHQCTSL